ncbi:MAG: prolipoprotein diacylglyceryl transferase [Firmicutes bacterium]|jgi:prolipoprotein diacylglyceryl transferase|nr:prolipoprotein diacylglyceryl transferase [Bacillota bacterium]
MDPIAFSIGGINIHWYGILVAAAFLIGYLLTLRNTRRYGLDEDAVQDLLFKLCIAVIVGARLGVIVVNLDYYLNNPLEMFTRAGLGSHGAIITAMILGYYWTKKANLPYWTLADAIAPGITVGHIFVRLGNFINGELYGSPTNLPWGIEFPYSGGPVHPAQLYEMFTSIILLPFALRWAKSPKYPGYAFFRVMLAHSIVRLLIDFIRQHSPLIGPFVLTQLLAIGFILLTLFLIIRSEKQHK